MTTPASLAVQARENADYDEIWTVTLGGLPLDLTGWTALKASFQLQGLSGIVLTLNQVATATEGLRPLSPLTAGVIRTRVLRATFAGIADGTAQMILTGDLVGVDPEGVRRTIADVTFTVPVGVTQP